MESPPLPEHAVTSPIMEMRYLDDVRPDIEFATSFLTMRMSKPTVALKKQPNYLLNYLGSSNDLSIRVASSNDQVYAYVDASYAIHLDSLSHYGLAICLGDTGYAIHSTSYPSRLCVALLPKQKFTLCRTPGEY